VVLNGLKRRAYQGFWTRSERHKMVLFWDAFGVFWIDFEGLFAYFYINKKKVCQG
jgi:hypothetical protein